MTTNAEFILDYEYNPQELIQENALLAELQEEEECFSPAQKAAMKVKEAEKAHTDVQTTLQLYKTAKKKLAVEKVTGINAPHKCTSLKTLNTTRKWTNT